MKINSCLTLIICLFAIKVSSQETVKMNLYATTEDFLSETFSFENAIVKTWELWDDYIRVKKIIDPDTGKKIKYPNRNPWMIEYKGVQYFNLGYASDVPRKNLFVRLDLEGKRLGALILDDYKLKLLKLTNSGAYGGGVGGLLMEESEKWGANWKNEKNERCRILIIDFDLLQPEFGIRNENSSWGFFLTKRHLIEIMEWDKKPKELKDFRLEQVIEYLNQKNNAS
jgi:hypothetical protein